MFTSLSSASKVFLTFYGFYSLKNAFFRIIKSVCMHLKKIKLKSHISALRQSSYIVQDLFKFSTGGSSVGIQGQNAKINLNMEALASRAAYNTTAR